MDKQLHISTLTLESLLKKYNIKDSNNIERLFDIQSIKFNNIGKFFMIYTTTRRQTAGFVDYITYNYSFDYKIIYKTICEYIVPITGTWYNVNIELNDLFIDIYITDKPDSLYKLITKKRKTLKFVEPQICPICDKEHTTEYVIADSTDSTLLKVIKHKHIGYDSKFIKNLDYNNFIVPWTPEKIKPICENCLKELELYKSNFINAINTSVKNSDIMSIIYIARELLFRKGLYKDYSNFKEFLNHIINNNGGI